MENTTEYLSKFTNGFNTTEIENVTRNILQSRYQYVDKNPFLPLFITNIAIKLFSFATNTIAVLVLLKTKEKSSTDIQFIGLSISDILHALTITTMLIIQIFLQKYQRHLIPRAVNIMFRVLQTTAFVTSNFIIVSLSLERNFAVIKPLTFRLIWTRKVGLIVTLAVYCLGLLTYLYMQFVKTSVYIVFAFVSSTASVLVVICNIITISKIKTSGKFAKSANSQVATKLKKDRKSTKILIGLSAFFVVCSMGQLANFVLSIYFKKIDAFEFLGYSLKDILYGVYSSLNSFIFVVLNSHYHKAFFQLFGCFLTIFRRKNTPPSVVKTTETVTS